jgi:hypothetical protein
MNNFIISYFKLFHFKLFKLVILNDSIKKLSYILFFTPILLDVKLCTCWKKFKKHGAKFENTSISIHFQKFPWFFSLSTLHLVFQTTPHVFNEDKVFTWAWAFSYFPDESNIIFKVFLHICLINLNIKTHL